MSEFVDYICGLAPEGDTALLVLQKPGKGNHAGLMPISTALAKIRLILIAP